MDLDLSHLSATTDWVDAVNRAAAASDDELRAIGAALIDDLGGSVVARRLTDPASLQAVARTVEATDEGIALTRRLATTRDGRKLVDELVASPAGGELARQLSGDREGQSPLGTVVGTDTRLARTWARHLVNSGPVKSLAERLLARPPAQARAAALLDGRTGQDLAGHLGRDASGLTLVRHLANSPAARLLALSVVDRRIDATGTRALAASPAAVALAAAVIAAPDGHLLVQDLLRSRSGSTLQLGLTEGPQGLQMLRALQADEPAARLRADLAGARASADPDGGGQVDGEVAVLRLVLVIALLLVLIVEPLAMAALVLLVAGAAAADPSASGDGAAGPIEATGATGPSATSETAAGARHRVTIDVGPQATLAELSVLLSDLDVLAAVSAEWARRERAFDGSGPVDGQGAVLTVPPATDLGGDATQVVEVRYRNPLEVVLIGARTLPLVLELARRLRERWAKRAGDQARKRHVEAETDHVRAMALKLEAEAEKARAEADWIRVEIARRVAELGLESPLSAGEVGDLILDHPGASDSIERLARYETGIVAVAAE